MIVDVTHGFSLDDIRVEFRIAKFTMFRRNDIDFWMGWIGKAVLPFI